MNRKLWDEDVTTSGARFSHCRTWRYALWRVWNPEKPLVAFIGLNPSKADEWNDDPTITRCRGFARRWGYGGILMLNIFAFRATYPRELYKAIDPIGPQNDQFLMNHVGHIEVGLAIAAWGNHGKYMGRGRQVKDSLSRLRDLHCLVLTKQGEPGHPLFLRGDLKPIPWKHEKE